MKKLPTLSDGGWLDTPDVVMNKLFEYYMASVKSQSTLFEHKVSSLIYDIANAMKPEVTADAIKNSLTQLYENYFNDVTVETSVTYSNENTKADIIISITVKENGKTYYLERNIGKSTTNISVFNNEKSELYI